MKRWLTAIIGIALVTGAASAQKQRYSQSRADPLLYPLIVHVTAAELLQRMQPVRQGDSVGNGEPVMILHITAVVDGKKIVLETGAAALLHAGDYQARIVSDNQKKSGWFSRTYELLFSDGTHVAFNQVAESE